MAPLLGTKWQLPTPMNVCSSVRSQWGNRTSLEDLGIMLPTSPRKMSACILLAQTGFHDHPQTSHCEGGWAWPWDHPCCQYHEYLLMVQESVTRGLVSRGRVRDNGGGRKANAYYVEVFSSSPENPFMPPWRSVSPPTSPVPQDKNWEICHQFSAQGLKACSVLRWARQVPYKSLLIIAKEIKVRNDFTVL